MSTLRRPDAPTAVDLTRTGTDPAAGHDVCLVVAGHDVADQLPRFLASLDAQTGIEHARVHVVLVDDGSSDGTLAVARAWEPRTAFDVTVLTRLEGGRAAARTLGLGQATGTWVTFPDPTDVLAPDYLDRVLTFTRAHPVVELVLAGAVLRAPDGTTRDAHPLRSRFAAGDRVLDLGGSPDVFCTGVRSTFFRRERIARGGVRFDPAVRPGFGPAHFAAVYLLSCPEPIVGLVGSARYEQQDPDDDERDLPGGPGTQRYADPDQYLVVPRTGYLHLLDLARASYGEVPGWVQSLVVQELAGFLAAASAPNGAPTPAAAVVDEFLETLRDIRSRLDDHVIAGYQASALDGTARQVLRHGLLDTPWSGDRAVLAQRDDARRLVRIATRFTGPEPRYEYVVDGVPVPPTHTKLRAVRYFGADLLQERIAWLPAGTTIRVRRDGTLLELHDSWPGAAPTYDDPLTRVGPTEVQRTPHVATTRQPSRAAAAARRGLLRRVSAAPAIRRRYGGAWVLTDERHRAGDNAEHLFSYLRDHRPDVNAWFTVEAGSPDHRRLRSGPHGHRVVAHGSTQWLLLMQHCTHLISSQLDLPEHRPPAAEELLDLLGPTGPRWRFTLLQDGVRTDDRSARLDAERLDLLVTSTPGEYASIVGDGSPSVCTDKETVLTGLPRFDRLRATSRSLRPQDRTLVLVAPADRDRFLASAGWLELLRSPALQQTAEQHGLRIGLLLPPDQPPLPTGLDLPAHVTVLTPEDTDVQRLIASAAPLVTDHSPIAFDAAYVDRPVVYVRFARGSGGSPGHLGRVGWFDDGRAGFGPVTAGVEEAVAAVREIAGRGGTPAPQYLRRIEGTFVLRDGRCCERVTAAVEALDRAAAAPAGPVRLTEPVPVTT